jgi:hypothetical protein
MIITKEQQEAWVSNYVKEKHTQDECIGFIDGINKALDVVNKNLVKPDVRRMLIDFCQSQEAYKIHTSDVELEKGVNDYLKSINFA